MKAFYASVFKRYTAVGEEERERVLVIAFVGQGEAVCAWPSRDMATVPVNELRIETQSQDWAVDDFFKWPQGDW